MSGSLGSFCYEQGDDDEEDKYFVNDKSTEESKDEEDLEEYSGEKTGLNESFSSSRSCEKSVTPRSDGSGGMAFKYKCCSICLTDFARGDSVKVVPQCGHTFHGKCLVRWLLLKFRCPNCNVEITAPS